MSNTSFEENLPDLVELIRRFKEAENALQSVLNEQVDAVLDPVTGIPILLEQAWNQLRVSEARYGRLLSLVAVVIFELAPDGTTQYVNETVFDILGYTAQELQGKNWWDVFFPGTRDQVDELYRQFQKGNVREYELTLITKSGSNAIIELTSANHKKPDGTLECILGLGFDITERRKAEKQLDAKQARLDSENRQSQQRTLETKLEKERVRLLKEFVQNASHEFRTPLTIINSSTYLLTHSDDPERRRLKAEEIGHQVQQMAKLLDMLLKMASLENNLPEQLPVDVQLLLQSVCKEAQAISYSVEIHCEIPSNLPFINGYSEYLHDALTHLLENARQHTPAGGRITVRAFTDNKNFVIEVEDTGPGISHELLPHIFETFSREDKAHTTPGLGLGLAITQKIINLHKGRIEVESEIGQGSLFRIFLPR